MRLFRQFVIIFALLCIGNITSCSQGLSGDNAGNTSVVTPEKTPEKIVNISSKVENDSPADVNTSKINLALYMDLPVDELIDQLQFNVGLRHHRNYDQYYSFDYSFGFYVRDNFVHCFWCESSLENMNFYGIQVGMNYSEACNILKEQGFERDTTSNNESDEEGEVAVFLTDPDKNKSIKVFEKEGKVSSYAYYWNVDLLDKPATNLQQVDNQKYSVKVATISYDNEERNTKVYVEYPLVEIKGEKKRTEHINRIINQLLEKVETDPDSDVYNYNLELTYAVTYNSEDILSLYICGTLEAGRRVRLGYGYTFDMTTGKLLNLSDIGADFDELNKKIKSELSEDDLFFFSDLTGKETEYYITEKELALFLGTSGSNGDYFIKTFDYDFKNLTPPEKAEVIDIYEYVDLAEDEFLTITGLELVKEKNEEFEVEYIYYGYNQRVEIYFDEDDKLSFIRLFTELPGYSFLGISVGMPIEEAIEELSKVGLSCEETPYTYDVFFNNDEKNGIIITTENDIIDSIYYY